jgi:predicted RNA-binding Zn-ribbon protein involved in translation (DUF1610 family)
LSATKECEVCGGNVKPVNDESAFGYCEKCGIVYLLKRRMEAQPKKETLEGIERTFSGGPESEEGKPWEEDSASQLGPQQAKHRWRCPDCGTVMDSTDEGDLEFIKREHVREYHPNRAVG